MDGRRMSNRKSAGLIREFLDSKAGEALGKALGESLAPVLEALVEGTRGAEPKPVEPVTAKPNPPIPTSVEVEQ